MPFRDEGAQPTLAGLMLFMDVCLEAMQNLINLNMSHVLKNYSHVGKVWGLFVLKVKLSL